jgi:hypothetical protein
MRLASNQTSTGLPSTYCPARIAFSSQDAAPLEAAADQAIAACGGDMREAIKALIVANDFLETEVAGLMRAVSQAYVRGRFKAYNG